MCTYTTARCRLPGLWDLQGLSAPAAELQLETRMGTPSTQRLDRTLNSAARPRSQPSGSRPRSQPSGFAALSTQRLSRALSPAARPRPPRLGYALSAAVRSPMVFFTRPRPDAIAQARRHPIAFFALFFPIRALLRTVLARAQTGGCVSIRIRRSQR